jgi:lipid II:glycine glycyltransferase (peptidoglycan interpeptide bridge formation enzyme)
VRLYEQNHEGDALCFIYKKSDDDFILYPFLKKSINQLPAGQKLTDEYFDISSPYGYGGYVRSKNCSIPVSLFFDTLAEYAHHNNIVSEFVRFHPWLKTQENCDGLMSITFWNQVVAVDLTKSEDHIWAECDVKNRNRIRKSIKCGVRIEQDTSFEFMDDFCRLYYQTMDRNNAPSFYYFEKAFFHNLITLLPDNCALFHAQFENRIIASLIVIYSVDFVHAYLAGTDEDFFHVAPCNLLFYKTALWAQRQGFKLFTLGGGRTADPNDSLLAFKKRFSKSCFKYYIGKKIHTRHIYDFLCRQCIKNEKADNILVKQPDFFPLYRRT